MTRLASLRWPQLVDETRLLVVPTGSCEQHGLHLPFDTDTRLAVAFADAFASRHHHAVVAPPVSIGASGEHQSFPGTLSIGTDAMTMLCVELARSALPLPDSTLPRPFHGLLFVNGHGGNVKALTLAERQLRSEGRPVVVWHPKVEGGDPHAGRTETSLMLHLCPEVVRMDLAEAGSQARFRDIGDTVATEGLAAVTPNGVLGDPAGATPAEGATLFAMLLEDLERSARLR